MPRLHRPASALLALTLAACGGAAQQAPAPGAGTVTATVAAAAPAPAPVAPPATDTVIKVVAVSDFHGWLLPLEPNHYTRYFGGIANLAGTLEHRDGVTGANSVILDNGDMWTGPTESTILRGESVVEAYNAMGLTAANVANHEFDFGVEILRARAQEAKFPFLGANLYEAGTDRHPDFVAPYVIVKRQGVKVGVVGLSYIDTPKTTLAKHVANLEFRDYGETLKKVVPEVKAAGAQVIVVLFHDELAKAQDVIKANADLGITAVVAGQNHRREQVEVAGIPVVNPGPFGRSYVRFDVTVDNKTGAVTKVVPETVEVTGEVGAPPFPPSPELARIAEGARQKAKTLASETLGRFAKPLPVGDFTNSPLGHVVVDSWLAEFPEVDFAMLNHGALRQPLPAGPVTMGDVVSALPFENNLLITTMTGQAIKAQLEIDHPIVGGMSWSYREQKNVRKVASLVDRVGKPIRDDKSYTVIILDFMYMGGDGFTFKQFDTAPVDTGISWRQPVLHGLRSAEASNRKISPKVGARARKVR
ncbi:MAG: bifunctional metallophosphatase/5'-nucleotidase [Deltaproteobacteria bacterium]|nr:bifunctional metallophosphatase/5'-nucleotidase [Deltaproteobacteria bacterium]